MSENLARKSASCAKTEGWGQHKTPNTANTVNHAMRAWALFYLNNYERTHAQHRNATRGVKYSSRNRADAKGFLFRSMKAFVFRFDDRPKATSAKIGYGGAQLRISLTNRRENVLSHRAGLLSHTPELSHERNAG